MPMSIHPTIKSTARRFVAAAVLAAVAGGAGAQGSRAQQQLDLPSTLGLKRVMAETHIYLSWSDDKPVVGAKVFDHATNTLLGVTDSSGRLLLTLPSGTVLRLVEPTYGQQQSVQVVQARPKTNNEMMSTTSTSSYVSTMRDVWMTF